MPSKQTNKKKARWSEVAISKDDSLRRMNIVSRSISARFQRSLGDESVTYEIACVVIRHGSRPRSFVF